MQLGIIVDDVSEVIKIDEQSTQSMSSEMATVSKNSIQGINLIDQRIIMVLDAVKLKSEIFNNNFNKELIS
jgi:purine-binding chemotaxis protein CheW